MSEENSAVKQADEKFCESCGKVIKEKAEICPNCGVRAAQPVPKTDKSKTTAGVLALFLGGIGAHKFYLGQSGTGLIYLLMCWTLIPALISLFEGLSLLTMSEEAFARKFGQIA
ncbi:NINE protein [Synergistaceae bacterium OttesenSCG-928-I11]|nr:NINE protein [Synergistaceae bacterium OttesenSCG-928-I11]